MHLSRFVTLVAAVLGVSLLTPQMAGLVDAVGSSSATTVTATGVTLLAPVGTKTAPATAFDGTVALRIEIFTLTGGSATGSPVGPSFAVGAPGARRIDIHADKPGKAHYHANWKTKDSRRPDGSLVRVELRLPSAPAGPACNDGVNLDGGCIGYFDVGLRKGNKGGSWPAGTLVVQNGQSLPIKVHIAQGALTPPPPSNADQLPGDPSLAAAGAIPEKEFEFDPDDYSPHPELGGLRVSFRTLYLAFTLDTTVAQANSLLSEIQAEIIGGMQGKPGQVEGLLYLRVPTTSHANMDALIDRLRADPHVLVAVQDSLLNTDETPYQFGEDTPFDWSWQVEPQGGNWGFEQMSVPQLWNLNRWIRKAGLNSNIGVLDGGFWDHTDLGPLTRIGTTAADDPDHGTHVAGTIAAKYNNHHGVDGVNPFANLYGMVSNDSSGGWGLLEFLQAVPDLDVVNISMGFGYAEMDRPRDPASDPGIQNFVRFEALVFRTWQRILEARGHRLPLIVVSAGNDSGNAALGNVAIDAKWNSPFTYAALVDGTENVLVVGALEPVGDPVYDTKAASFSDINAQTWAPGFRILSLGSPTEPYRYESGTSMAAPAVAGIAGYLHSLDPTLTPAELVFLLGAPVSYRHKVDAFWAALSIDGLRNNSTILTRLLDIDDGTTDGNLRLVCDDSECSEITTEDFDMDGGQGDGVIDMSDFRRWRDMFLQANEYPELALDGAFDHPKKDLNHDGLVFGRDGENVFPDGDFNGDGKLDLTATRFMPGYIHEHVADPHDAQLTDLQVLQFLFDDPDYAVDELPDLIESSDIHVNVSKCIPGGGYALVTVLDAATEDWLAERELIDTASVLLTVPILGSGHIVRVEVYDDNGDLSGLAQSTFEAKPGNDSWYKPTCGVITLEPRQINIILDAGDSTTESAQLTSTGLAANWEFTNSVANVVPSTTGGSITAGGQATIDVTVTCPAIPRGYGGLFWMKFSDDRGQTIDDGVPEYLAVDIVCLEGGVVLEPTTLKMSAQPGETATNTFSLRNKGTALLYEATPGEMLAIEEDAEGDLPKLGTVQITVQATCPDEEGEYDSSVGLTFERADGKPVTVPVPESLPVELTCEWRAPFRWIEQHHIDNVMLAYPYKEILSQFRSFPDTGKGTYTVREQGVEVRNEEVPWNGFGPQYSSINIADTFELCRDEVQGNNVSTCPPGPNTRTRSASTDMNFDADIDGPRKVTFIGDYSMTYSQSGRLYDARSEAVSVYTKLHFTLLEPAELEAAWACNDDVDCGIDLHDCDSCGWVFTSGTGDGTFTGTLDPGNYTLFVSNSLPIAWSPYDWGPESVSEQASYRFEFTFPEDAP